MSPPSAPAATSGPAPLPATQDRSECLVLSDSYYKSLGKVSIQGGTTSHLKTETASGAPDHFYCVDIPFSREEMKAIERGWRKHDAAAWGDLNGANRAKIAILRAQARFETVEKPAIEARAKQEEAAQHPFPWGTVVLATLTAGVGGVFLGSRFLSRSTVPSPDSMDTGPDLGERLATLEGERDRANAALKETEGKLTAANRELGEEARKVTLLEVVQDLSRLGKGVLDTGTEAYITPIVVRGNVRLEHSVVPQFDVEGKLLNAVNIQALEAWTRLSSPSNPHPYLLPLSDLRVESSSADSRVVYHSVPQMVPADHGQGRFAPDLGLFVLGPDQTPHIPFVTRVFLDLASGLDALHGEKLAHNQVEPRNVLYSKAGMILIDANGVSVGGNRGDIIGLGNIMLDLCGVARDAQPSDMLARLCCAQGVPETLARMIVSCVKGETGASDIINPKTRQKLAVDALNTFGAHLSYDAALQQEWFVLSRIKDSSERVVGAKSFFEGWGERPIFDRLLPRLLCEAGFLSPEASEIRTLVRDCETQPWTEERQLRALDDLRMLRQRDQFKYLPPEYREVFFDAYQSRGVVEAFDDTALENDDTIIEKVVVRETPRGSEPRDSGSKGGPKSPTPTVPPRDGGGGSGGSSGGRAPQASPPTAPQVESLLWGRPQGQGPTGGQGPAKMSMLESPAVHPILHGIVRDSVAMVSGGILGYGIMRGLEDAGVKIKPGTRQAAIGAGMGLGLYGSMAVSFAESYATGGAAGLAMNLVGLGGVMTLAHALPFDQWSMCAADASVNFFCKTFDVNLSPETAMMARAVVQNGYNLAMISIAMRIATPVLGAVFAPVARAALPLAQVAWVRVAPQLMNGFAQGSRLLEGAMASLQTGARTFWATPAFVPVSI